MRNLAKRVWTVVIVLIITAVVSMAVELLYFNYHALNKKSTDSILLTGQDLLAYTVGFAIDGAMLRCIQENATISIYVDNAYYSKLMLKYESPNDGSIIVQCYSYDSAGSMSVRDIQDYYDHRLTQSVTNLNQYCYKVVIHVPETGFKIARVELINKVSINRSRLLFIVVCILISMMLLFGRRSILAHVHTCFILISVMLGALFMVLVPLKNPVVWDDDTHFLRIYRQSFYHTVLWTQSAYDYSQRMVPYANSIEEKYDVFDYLNQDDNNNNVIKVETTNGFIPYNMRGYLPQSVMVALARWLGLDFGYLQLFGRIGGFLSYILIVYYAIRIAKTGQRLIAVIALLPTPMFMAANFSYDPLIIALSILGFVIFTNEYMELSSILTTKSIALFIIAIVVASFSKTVYVPLLLLTLLFPSSKFYSKKQMFYFKTGILILFTLMMLSFVLPTILNPSVSGDIRGGETTSVAGQIRFILDNPLFYLRLLARSIWDNLGMYFLGNMALLNFAYLGLFTNNTVYLAIFILLLSALTDVPDDKYAVLNVKSKIYIVLLIFSIICLIWTALYLSFTPVGLNQINGVQPRYYIPLLLPLLYVFRCKNIKSNIDPLWMNRITLGVSTFIILNGIYNFILKPFNF